MADTYVAPCGSCRQFIAEFGLNMIVILVKNRQEYREFQARDILPLAFGQSTLDLHRDTYIKSSKLAGV